MLPKQSQVKQQKTAEITYLEAKKKQTWYRLTYLEVWKYEKEMRLMFGTPRDSVKGNCYVFNNYKQRNKVCLAYLECKHRNKIGMVDAFSS